MTDLPAKANAQDEEDDENKGLLPYGAEIVHKLIENEVNKLKVEEKRIELDDKDNERRFQYAMRALEAQQAILQNRPTEKRKTITRIGYMCLAVIVLSFVFFAYCIHKGKEQLVFEGLKYIGIALLAFISGNYYGKDKKSNKSSSKPTDNSPLT